MENHLLKEEDYYPRVTTEIRHGFLLVWMGHVGRDVLSGRIGECDFHFDEEAAKEILVNFDRRSIDIMKSGYPVESTAIPDKYLRIAEGKIMKKEQVKTIIKLILNEAVLGGIFGSGQNITPKQKMTVDLLTKRSFKFIRAVPGEGGATDVILERPWGKGKHGGPRYARVTSDGTIGNDKLDVNKYLSVVGERIDRIDPRFSQGCEGPMDAVNVDEIAKEDVFLEEAKELAKKIWGDKVKLVSPFPAKSTTEYFKINIEPDDTEWLALTQTSGWLYSKNDKMISVNDLGVNEIFTLGDVLKAGFGTKFPSGTKLSKKHTFFSDIPVGSIFVLGSGKHSDYYKKLDDKNFKNVKTGKIGSTYGHDFRASVADPNFEKGHQQFKDKYTERTNPDGTYIDDMESGIKSQAYSGLKESRWLGGDERPCDCGSGVSSEWEYDGQNIPLCRVCPKCRAEKLKKYRPEILRPYSQSDVDEPIEPDGDDLWESNSEHKYWMSYKEHQMVAAKKSNDIVALLRYAKQVGADEFGIYMQSPGFHSTTQQEFLVAWYDKSGSGYWSNMAKKNPELKKIQIKSLNGVPVPKLKEQTSSGAAGGQPGGTIQVPAWGTKNKMGSPRAIKAAKKYGKVVKSISEKVT